MCKSCEVVRINGVLCHESGCPDSWQDEVRECKECGIEFKPENKYDNFCSESCYCIYNDLDFVFEDTDEFWANEHETFTDKNKKELDNHLSIRYIR